MNGVWRNPHSDQGDDWGNLNASTLASSSSAAADRVRQLTLDMCQADPNEYVCILTSGATAALKLVADSFPWSASPSENINSSGGSGGSGSGSGSSRFLYLSDNHNSVLGIREVAAAHGAEIQCVNPSDIQLPQTSETGQPTAEDGKNQVETETQHLFAFPLESNFSGTRYSEELVVAVQNQTVEISSSSTTTPGSGGGGKWRVLLDAAKACATNPPNLSQYPADFVALSYYKIFGYPTGLGALLVKRDALCTLRKTYFSGGTVLSSSAEDRFHALRPGYAGFEDGTLPFLAFPAVLQSFSAWTHRGGFPVAAKIADAAASRFAEQLVEMKHSNGSNVATVYGQWNCCFTENNDNENNKIKINLISGQGPTVTFNLLDPQGQWVGHRQVQRIASLEGIYLRTGVMCNPGACSTATGVKAVQAKSWFDHGHVCWDDQDVLDGVPTGAVRVSFGWGSSIADADALVTFVKRHFVCSTSSEDKEKVAEKGDEDGKTAAGEAAAVVVSENNQKSHHDDLRIHSLTIYPIKSAAGFSPRSWPISSTSGLLYDRHWAVVDAYGSILTLKKCPQLSCLHPVVYLEDGVMRIHAKGMKHVLEVPLPNIDTSNRGSTIGAGGTSTAEMQRSLSTPPCFHFSPSSTCTDASEWLSEALGIPCSLIEYQDYKNHSRCDSAQQKLKSVAATDGEVNHGFSNEAQILLVTIASLQAIYKKSEIEASFDKFAARFRPNIIVEEKYLPPEFEASEKEEIENDSGDDDDGSEEEEEEETEEGGAQVATTTTAQDSQDPIVDAVYEKEDELLAFEEEQWTLVTLCKKKITAPATAVSSNITSSAASTANAEDDGINFEVVGPCPRCEMVCIDPTTGIRQGPEPLLTLARERKGAGKRRFCFGVLMNVKEGVVVGERDGSGSSSVEVVEGNSRMKRVAVGMHVNYETQHNT